MNGKIGLNEVRAALQNVSSKDLKKMTKGIAIAIGIEEEGISFYSKQAGQFRGSETEHFFQFLAGQEKEHLKAINSLKESLEQKGKWIQPKLPKKERPAIFAKKDWDKGNKEGLTAVLFALWKENQAQEFYLGIAERVEDKGAKQFFLALAEFEKMHAEMLAEYAEESYYTHELIMG